MRWLHDGIARASRSRVAILDHRTASCILRENPNGTDDHTKMTLFDKMHSRCTPRIAIRRAKWTHELNTKMNHREMLREIFGMSKILSPLPKLISKPEKLHQRSYDGSRWPPECPDVFTIRAEYEHFFHRVSILA